MKTGYYTIKNTFKESDPEGKGIVSRYGDYTQAPLHPPPSSAPDSFKYWIKKINSLKN